MRGKVILFFIVTCLVAMVVISLALVTMNAYPGGEICLSPTDVRILRGGVSSVWCDGQIIQSDGTAFNASVVPGNPRINPNTRHKKSIELSQIPLTPSKGRVYWRFYLPAGSNLHLSQCAKTDRVMGYVLRGHDVVEGCIYYSLDHLVHILKSNNNCKDIWMSREIVRTCRGSKQMIDVSIVNDDYYLVLYQSSNPGDTFVSVNITLDTPTYDLSNSIANCSSDQECTLPLSFFSDNTVVASLFANITSNDSNLSWKCSIRSSIYLIVFLGVPVLIGIIVGIGIICFVKRKAKTDPPVTCNPPIAEPREVDREKESLLPRREDVLPPAIDPRLRQMGPIPGPSVTPNYLSNAPSAPREDDNQPFTEPFGNDYPPAPPSYDETMRSEPERRNRSERVAEKC